VKTSGCKNLPFGKFYLKNDLAPLVFSKIADTLEAHDIHFLKKRLYALKRGLLRTPAIVCASILNRSC